MVATTVAISVVVSALVLILRTPLSELYTSSSEVISLVVQLTPLLAISIFLNGVQPILSGIVLCVNASIYCSLSIRSEMIEVAGVAIGSGWQAIVAYVNVGAYYFIGLPIGCLLGFKTSLGAAVSTCLRQLCGCIEMIR